MATKIYFRRGTRSQIEAIVPESGEPVWATDEKKLYLGDGAISGGIFIGGYGVGVDSINELIGSVTLSGAGIVEVTEEGQIIVVSGQDVPDVDSLNTLTGVVTISGGAGIIVTVSGQTIVVAETTGGFDVDSLNNLQGDIQISGVGGTEVWTDGQKILVSGGGGGSDVQDFLDLDDTPASFVGQKHKVVAINEDEDAVEFVKTICVESSLSSDGDYAGIICSGVAGESLVFGNTVYYGGDSKWKKTTATDGDTIDAHVAIVVSGNDADSMIWLLLMGYMRNDSWSFATGSGLWFDVISGQLSNGQPSDSGDYVKRAGFSHKTNIVWFNPDNTVIKRA